MQSSDWSRLGATFFCALYHSPLISLEHSRICDTAAVASCEGRGTWDKRMGGHHHRVGDTMMMQSVGDAPVVVNPTLSVGDTMFIFQIILVKNCYNLEENY